MAVLTLTKPQLMLANNHLPRDLGDGLVLRFATPADTEAISQFNGRIHGQERPDRFDPMVAAWTRDFCSESHPTCGPSNVTLVEDTRAGTLRVVSSMCLIPQTWTYAGIPFGVGRPEAVGTDPDYRRRGLVRVQFDVLHAKSAAMGHLVQGITGIPWYYRQFGYEYALDLVVVEGQSLRAVMPSVLCALRPLAQAQAAARKINLKSLYWRVGREHPVFEAIPELLPKLRQPYGWYIRVSDVPGFLRHIAPVLEARLARSPLAGHTGELKITEYRGGFRMALENGKLTAVERWQSVDSEGGDANAAFPPLVFLQLLFGRRSLSDLRAAFPDCWAQDEATALLNVLFPGQSSCVMPVG